MGSYGRRISWLSFHLFFKGFHDISKIIISIHCFIDIFKVVQVRLLCAIRWCVYYTLYGWFCSCFGLVYLQRMVGEWGEVLHAGGGGGQDGEALHGDAEGEGGGGDVGDGALHGGAPAGEQLLQGKEGSRGHLGEVQEGRSREGGEEGAEEGGEDEEEVARKVHHLAPLHHCIHLDLLREGEDVLEHGGVVGEAKMHGSHGGHGG